MPDEPRDLTPDETERVRRLLARARHTDPVPDDVAARLDRTLASLADERRERREDAVTVLASRRRRTLATVLVAAVAVVAVGIGLGRSLPDLDMGAGGSDSTSADGGATSVEQERPAQSPEQPQDQSPGRGAAPEAGAGSRALPGLGDDTFDSDVLALRGRPTATEGGLGSLGDTACARPTWGEGRRVPVRYDGAAAVLVFRDPVGGVQPVDLFRCGADAPLRSTTVPAP